MEYRRLGKNGLSEQMRDSSESEEKDENEYEVQNSWKNWPAGQ